MVLVAIVAVFVAAVTVVVIVVVVAAIGLESPYLGRLRSLVRSRRERWTPTFVEVHSQ